MTAIREQYLQVKRNYPDVIVFFRLGDFYETFDDDAKKVSKELEIVLTSREMGKGNKIPMAGIPYHAVDNYLAKLINRGYKVAICEQLEEPDSKRGIIDRQVTRVVTPGTVVEPNMLQSNANNFLAAVVYNSEDAGFAYIDITTGEFAVSQLPAGQLQNEIERVKPAEVLAFQDLPQFSSHTTKIDENCFDLDESTKTLLNHFQASTLEGYGCSRLPMAVKAAGAILHYIEKTQRNAMAQITRLTTYTTDSFMIIDQKSAHNLEIFENTSGNVKGSLLSVLDITRTPMGVRLLKKWLGQPLLDIKSIEQRQNGIGWFYANSIHRADIIALLGRIGDIERMINRVSAGIAIPRELMSLKTGLEIVPRLKAILKENKFELIALADELKSCDEVVQLIIQAIVDNPSTTVGEGETIKRGFSRDLDDLISKSRNAKQYIADLEKSERQRSGIKSLKVGYNRVFGYYIEVTTPHLDKVPSDYIRKQTLSTGERYYTTQLKEFESIIVNAESRIADLETDIYRQVCRQIAGSSERILGTAAVIAQLDVLCAMAEVAVRYNYTRPVMNEDNQILIRNGRHPVVERHLSGESFIPNDTELSNKDNQLIILTGPNMSGKSTYLRQVALIVLLAQTGSFVPAESAKIGLVDRIFTRIGAQEDISAGQSTFMVEMVETANILNNATPKSLLILDEIGRGTSTYDGLSIAYAVAEYIHNHPKLGAKTIFATHYHELVELAGYLPRVKNFNVAVTEDNGKVVFLRKIVPGGTDKSYGIHVAQLAGLPGPVLHRAGEVLSSLEESRSINKNKSKSAHKKEPSLLQLTFFQPGSPVIDELLKLDISSISPLEAINKLYELQNRAKE